MNHIEQAYKAWRATVKDDTLFRSVAQIAITARHGQRMTANEKRRKAVKSFWQTLTPEQRSERQRKAAKKMWKRRKAEARDAQIVRSFQRAGKAEAR